MAPPDRMECLHEDCQFSTPEGIPTWDLVMTCMGFHIQAAHPTTAAGQPGAQAQGQAKPRAEKVPEAPNQTWDKSRRVFVLPG